MEKEQIIFLFKTTEIQNFYNLKFLAKIMELS